MELEHTHDGPIVGEDAVDDPTLNMTIIRRYQPCLACQVDALLLVLGERDPPMPPAVAPEAPSPPPPTPAARRRHRRFLKYQPPPDPPA